MPPLYVLMGCQRNGLGSVRLHSRDLTWPEAVAEFQYHNEIHVKYGNPDRPLMYSIVARPAVGVALAQAA